MRVAMAVLVAGYTLVGFQKPQAKGELAQDVLTPECAEAIHALLVAEWDGWRNQDPIPDESIVADDFHGYWPDGSRHTGRPTKQQMVEQPIVGYRLSEFRVVPVAANTALVTYLADIKTPDNLEHRLAVGEVWVKQNGAWRIHAFSGTLAK